MYFCLAKMQGFNLNRPTMGGIKTLTPTAKPSGTGIKGKITIGKV